MEEQLLKDFIATAQANNYNYDVVLPKFPELSGYDIQVLKDYIATAEANNYDYDTVNAKFPELFSAVKKKEETVTDFVSEPGSLVSPEPEVPVAETVVEEEFVQPVVADATRIEEPVLPTEQIEQPDLEDFVVYEDPGAEIVTEAEGEKNTWVEDFAGKNFVTDFFGDIYRAGAAGQAQGGSVDESLELMTKGKDVTDEDIQDFLAAQERMASQGESEEMKEFNKIYEANGKGFLGFLMGTAANPTILPQLFVSSVSAMATPATLAAGAAGAGAGAAIGATGFSAGPLGVFTTAGGALTGAMGAMGTTLETGLAFSEFLQEQLEKKGLEMTTEGIRKVLEDPEAIKSMRYRAAGRGIAIGAFNAVTAGVGSQVVKSVAKATGRKAVAGLAGAGVEVVSESTGEVVGRLVAGQEMDVAEIGFEGFAGGVPQVVGLGRGLYKSPTYKVNGETVSGPVVADFIKNAPVKDLVGATLEIKNDPVLKDIAIKRREDARMDAIIKAELAKAGITDEGAVTALTKLEKERRGLEGNGTRAAQQRLAEVNKEIDGLMDGAKIAYTETVDASGDKVTTEVIVTKEYAREELIKDGIESPTEQQVEAKQAELFEDAMEAVQKPQEDAIQEQGPESVDAPESTRDSEAVGEGVPDIGEPTTEVEAQDDVTDEATATTAEVAVEESNAFKSSTGDSDIDGRITRTVMMSPDEYLKQSWEATDGKLGGTYESWLASNKGTKETIESYAKAIREGDKFPLPYIDKARGSQDGRNRALAAKEAGLEEIPVGIIEGLTVAEEIKELKNDLKTTTSKAGVLRIKRKIKSLETSAKKVAPKKTVSEPTQEVTEEEQVDIDEFFSDKEIEGVDKIGDNLVVNRKQLSEDKAETAQDERKISRIKQIAKKAAVSLKKQFPDVKIVLHETEGQYKRFAGKRARGTYLGNDKTIHINLSIADLETMGHEVFHAILLETVKNDPNAVIVSRKMLDSIKKVVDPNSKLAERIDKFVAKYADAPIVQDEEYLAELMGILSAEYTTLDKPAQNAIKEFLRKLAKLIGIDKKFGLDEYFGPEFLKTDAEVIDLLNTVSRKVSQGAFIEASDVAVIDKIRKKSTPEELKKARKDVEKALDEQDARKAAEERGIMAREQIVGERASLEDDVRDGLDMAMLTYTEQGDSKKVRREVKAAWGWEKGADGKWRYEIETGKLKKVPNGTYKLSDVYDAPELYKAYPEVKDISLTINVRDTGAEESWFIINKNAVEINVKNYGRVRPDLIHELQHYIQFKEGFAIGGNANTAIDLINSLSPDKLKEINILEGKESAMSMLSDIAEESELTYVDDLKSIDTIEDFLNRNTKDANLLNSLYGDDAASYVLGVLNEDLIDLEDGDLMGGIYQVLQTIQEQTENKDGRSMWSPYAVYQRLIGEVEARNAASRDGGGRSLIEDSEDTPRADQLAVFGEQEKVLRKIEAKEEMTEQELDALDLAKLPAQEGSKKGAGLFYGPRATIANYESAKTMFADGVPAEDIEILTGWNVVEKQNGDVVYVLSRNEVESKDTIDKAIASRKDQGVAPRQQVSITDTDSTNPSFEKGSMKDFSVEGGILEIGKVKGAKQSSVLRLSVDEDNRRQGKATELLKSALNYTNGMLSAMASKDAAVGLNYKLGMRAFSPDGNELSLEETKNQRAENAGESIRMELPDSKKGNNYKAFDEGMAPRQQVEGINPKDVRMRSRSGNRVGKGLSVKKVNKEAVVEEIPDLTLDYVRENAPASYLKNANLIAQYPLVRGVKNFDEVSTLEQADEVYEVYARQVADNLNWIMESYPEEYREISTLWYDGANKIANELAADYGVSPEQVAGIIASLSPQNDWYQNVRAAELSLLAFRENPVMSQKMIDYQVNYAEGKINDLKKRIKSARKAKGKSQAKAKVEKFKAAEVKNLKAIADAEALLDLLRSYKGKRMEDAPDALKPYYVRLYNEVNQPKSYPIISPDGNYGSDALTDAGGKRKFGWGSYTEIGKGVSIRLDGSQENISVTLGQMHKIRNFFNNIIDPMSKEKDITMDTHAIAAALLIPASSKTKEVVQNFGTGTANSGVKGQKGLYYANQAGYFLSAEENNMLPRQVQSVTWEAVRGLFTSKFKDGAKNVKSINDIWENYAEGNITIEQARQEVLEKADGINAPSWAGLISDESRDGDGTTTERGRGKRGGPATEREGVAPRQQVVYHVTIRDNKGDIQKKGLEKDRPAMWAKGIKRADSFDTSGKSFAFSNLEDAIKWGIKTKIEKDKEVSIVAINAEGKTLQEDKALTGDPFNPFSSAVFTEDVISPSDILSVEDVDYKMGEPFDKSGEPLSEESFDIKDDVAPRQQKPYPSGPEEAAKMGYLVHASDKSRDSFDKKFIKGRNRTELGALGFYFTANAQKAMDYGGEYTYIDPADMNLLNLDEVKGNKLQGFLSDLERNLGKLSSYRIQLIAAQDEVRSIPEYNEIDAELKKVDAQIKAQSPFGTSAFSQDRVLQALKKAKAKNLMDAYKVAENAIERDGRKSDTDAAFSDLLFNAGYDGIYEGPGLYKVAIFDIDGLNNAIVKPGVAPRQQLEDIATPLPRQQKSVREVVQQARDNNFKDAATKDFLKRKGVPTADIDKAIKTLDDVYARVMKEIAGVIAKSQKRGVPFNQQLDNALAYLQGTKLYEDTTDIHREKLIREVRAKFDKKEKRAPSAKRILGNIKDVKKVTLSEKEALKMQLRLVAKTAKTTARALVVAGNELTKSLKEMVNGGVITANQMSSVLRRFSRVDLFNPASIDSFLDYMAKIFADAEYGAKIARIKKLLPRAKKNIKSKIGVADVLGDTLTKLFNVNPTLIPMEMLEDYIKLVEMMGASKNVLPLADINDVTEVANKVLNAVYEEISMAEDLAEVFANYENKVIKDGKLDYAATIDAMIADQTISLEEAAVMRKYKSRIVESTTKEPKTEAEIAEERAELMSAVEAAKVNVSRLVMEEERTLARQLAKLMRTEAIERLSNQQLETLLAVIDNINNGFVTHAAQRLAETMNASNRAESLSESVAKAKPLSVSTFIGKIKAGITKNNKFFESVKRNPLAYLDQVFGDFKTTRIYDAIFKPLAQAYDTFSLEMKRVDQRLTDAQNAVMKSFKNDPNKARMSSYKMMAYMLQREFEANPDNKQVNPAADFIRATIDHINKGQSFFKGKDAEMLQQILDDFGGEQIDSQKLYDSFNKAERNALAVMEDINKSMGSKAVFTGAVIRGRRVDALNQYAHHNVLSTSGQMDRSADVSIIEAYNQSMRASTKAKNLIERTGVATPLNFDVFSSVSRGSRFTLTDFYLTEPIRTSRKTISDTRKLLEERGDVTKQENEIVNSIENALELALDDLLTRTFSQSTMLENVVQYVKKTGYRLVLASATRAGAEYLSNVNFAVIYAPKDFAAGMANKKMVMGTVGIDVMSNLKSTQLSRMYPNEILSGRMIDTSVLGEKAGDKGGRAYGDVRNKITQIYNGLLSPAKKGIELVADTLISAPDKAIIRPLWFGSFENAFVEITGKKPDFEKISANDEAYMEANQEALDKATDTADQVTTLAGAADNPFKSMLRGKYPSKAKQTALLQFFNNFNSFMTRFLIYEYISARTAVNAMMGNGMISKRQGAALLGAVVTRMVTYTLLNTVFALLLKQAFGLGDEEDEKDIENQFGQALASTAVSLIVGRDFGNVVKGLLNYGVENLNEEFLDELRDGDYDPYRDSIAYTFVPADKEYKSNTLADYIRNLMGPFGTFYKMAEFGVKALSADEKKDPAARLRQLRELNERLPLEVLGNLGLIPLYRDIRALLLADIYKGMGKEKKGGKTGMTKSEKAQMKEYFPEIYEMQMQMEEDMKNPELERFEKEMKLLEKQIEESLKQSR